MLPIKNEIGRIYKTINGGHRMTVRDLVQELIEFDMDAEVLLEYTVSTYDMVEDEIGMDLVGEAEIEEIYVDHDKRSNGALYLKLVV